MKFEHEAETSQNPLGYFLIPEGEGEEMRFLTNLADLAQRPDVRLRVVGSKRLNQAIPGQPANPVIKLKIVVETLDGRPLRAAELLAAERAKALDPNQRVHRHQTARQQNVVQRAKDRNMRITQGDGHVVIEE